MTRWCTEMGDAFAPLAPPRPGQGFAPTLLIAALDAARREAAAEAAPEPEPEAGPDPMEALLAEARQSAWEDGRAAGLAEAEAASAAVAARAAEHALAALREGAAAARKAAAEAAADLARVALAMLDAALPGLAADNAAALAAAFARRLAPALEVMPEARLLVPPGLAEATRALLGPVGIAVEEDPALPAGDARAEWRGGGAALDLAARRAEIRRVLESAGLGPKE